MSSYVSGVYDIRASVAARLRAEAMQELRAIESEAAQLKAEHDAAAQRREALQAQRIGEEATACAQAHEQHQSAVTAQRSVTEEASLLLEEAAARIAAMNDAIAEKNALLEKLADMQESVDRFGVTTSTIKSIRALVRETVPAALMRIHQQQEKARLEQELQEKLRIESTVIDESIDFVSMKVEAQARKAEIRPWDLFVSRVKALAARQEEFGGSGAEDLLKEMEDVAPQMQSLFMLQNEETLAEWEAEAAAFSESIEQTRAQQAGLYRSYLSVYRAYADVFSLPLLCERESINRIQLEMNRITELVVERRRQTYLEQSFREVFEAHGLAFESMAADERQTLHIEFAMDEESGVRVSRSESGAFEMVFVGKSASSAVSGDQRRRVCEKAKKFCDLMPSISADLEARGILFDQRMLLDAQEESIAFEIRGQARRHTNVNARTMHLS